MDQSRHRLRALHALVAGGALLLALNPCQAGRPLLTDDAAVLDAGKCEFESSLARDLEHHAVTRSGQMSCGIAGNTQLAIATAHDSAAQGGNAFALHGKTFLGQFSSQNIGVAIDYTVFGAQRPHQKLRQSGTELRAVLTLPTALWFFHANLAWARAAQADHLLWSLAAERPAALGPIDLMAEVLGDHGRAPRVQFAARWALLPERCFLDAAWGVRVDRPHEAQVSSGLRIAF